MQKEDEEIAHKKMVIQTKKARAKGLADLLRAKSQTPLTESLDLGNSI